MAENFYGATDTGRVRENNEDAFIAERLPTGWIAACAIDGVGGYEGGEVAADIARNTLLAKLKAGGTDAIQLLRDALHEANRNIYNEKMAGKGNSQMACVLTLALCDIGNNQLHYAHVGDTRMYLLRDGSLVKLTKDQSFVGFLEDSGRLSEKEAMAHPKRNEINKALGFDAQIDLRNDYIETGSSPFLPGDTLLLCSDGLTDMVDAVAMTSVLTAKASLAQKAKRLIDAANAAGGKDNITVVLVQNDKKSPSAKATKPLLVKKADRPAEPLTPPPTTAPLVSPTPVAQTTAPPPPQKSSLALWLMLPLLLLAGLCYWLWQQNKNLQALLPKPPATASRNAGETKLADALGLVSHELILSPDSFAKSIVLTDTMFARQDTLLLDGRGTVLQADSGFAGPALVVSPNNKLTRLQNITFRGFGTALLLRGSGLQLRNVRFENCAAPILRQAALPSDSSLTAVYRDTLLFKKDSLPK